MDIETKLKRFSEVVQKEAEELKNKKLEVIELKHETSIKSFENKAEEKYDAMLKDAAITAEKHKQKQIAKKNAEIKKELIQKRTNYINNVFENVLNKLNDFFETAEYEQLIVDMINSYKGSVTPESITCYVMKRDKGFVQEIAKKTGVTVLVTDEDFLGGVRIILDKNRSVDCTLKHKLDREKAAFNKIRIV